MSNASVFPPLVPHCCNVFRQPQPECSNSDFSAKQFGKQLNGFGIVPRLPQCGRLSHVESAAQLTAGSASGSLGQFLASTKS